MVETATKRLSWLSSFFIIPIILVLSWWAWQGLEDDLRGEAHRISHFEQLAAYHVVNNLGFELLHLQFNFGLGIKRQIQEGTTLWEPALESLVAAYRSQAHYPGLLADVALVSEKSGEFRQWKILAANGWVTHELPDWVPPSLTLFDQTVDPWINIESPLMTFSLPPRDGRLQALVIRYDMNIVLKTIVPELVRLAFSEGRDSGSYQGVVIRENGNASDRNPEGDLVVPLFSQVKFSDWLRNYLDRTLEPSYTPDDPNRPFVVRSGQATEARWALEVRYLPRGLKAHVHDLQVRNFEWAASLFLVLVAGFVVFLYSVLRILRATRRERTFSNLVSHELKTPISALQSLSENLSSGVVSEPSKVKEYGEALLEQTGRLTEMVGNILFLARMESPGGRLTKELFDAAELVREAGAASSVPVRLAEGPWLVRGNRAAVRAALDNLLTNALRYGVREGAEPDVALGLHRQKRFGRSWIGLSVSDHGPGVALGDRKHLFQAFQRGTAAHERQIPGSGIGLSLVKATMKHLEGRVQVDPVPGGGLRFLLWLQEGGEL